MASKKQLVILALILVLGVLVVGVAFAQQSINGVRVSRETRSGINGFRIENTNTFRVRFFFIHAHNSRETSLELPGRQFSPDNVIWLGFDGFRIVRVEPFQR